MSTTEGAPTFPFWHRAFRSIWASAWVILCSWTPPIMWRWRRFVLRCFGADIGFPCDVRGSVKIWFPPNLVMENWTMLADGVNCYNVAKITIRTGSLVSQRAHLCAATHDINNVDFPLVAKPISIGKQCWIAAEAFIGPGVSIGEGSVVGARSAVFKNLDPWGVYRGNPATYLKPRPPQPMMQVSQRTSSFGEPIGK